ncbi:ATP-binding cassette domain-containing protein [Rathayibacter sp. VKM Ac-2803]|uniref:ABC transporter ATP-binding protein n=1 Tax=unclassified Rathayibacter TaxID=2609250 RepID=UPI00135964FF|nr:MULTISPECIES: ABC transporter ATP-binding protein [unclassified Rathayibacter]MWV49311.1 ATP-binding cassette domain-containing protein [Rathayibacter sp. VKM Ac-2803]MWV59939.1 ATP-binding cassette domain-containing protein [Rathayibacter sp. VKM Ac-2754]
MPPLLAARRPAPVPPVAGPLIDLREVSVQTAEGTLLAPVSLQVEPGEVVAVTGPNGSGKTTLLRVIAGLLPPTSGVAQVAGRPADERTASHRRAVAALVQTPPLERDLTLEEHLAMVAVSWGARAPEAREQAARGLASLALAPLARRFPHELSSGQRQSFSLALVLARPSDVLLLDEPEQRLDADRVPLVVDVLGEAAPGRAVVIATHSSVITGGVATRVLELGRS